MVAVHPRILERRGKKQFAVLPYDEFSRPIAELEDYRDLRLLRAAKSAEGHAPGISLTELKPWLGFSTRTKSCARRPRRSS
ncbi:MAG: hypothetical protein A3K18_25505 [Lentisphaerae bacterium RIFOXYA12_64_32]|nr:MAG: hypothetical protein A3K18_25505 [Lentisphaerae bacterium RIFOXYA12_64_32]